MGLNELAIELVNGCVGTLGDFEVKKAGGGGGNRLPVDKVLEGGVIRVIVELKVGLFISRNVIGEEDDDEEEEEDDE